MLTMAKKRKPGAGRPKGPKPPRKMIMAFKGSEEFAEWLKGLVEHCRTESGWPGIPAASVVERALICLAKEKGYSKAPPER